eukprot:Nk52_evm1s1701 gene=Nk52_evmTU1s1701
MIGMKSLLLVTLLASAAFLFSGASAGDTWGNYPGCGNDVNSNYHWKYKFCKNPDNPFVLTDGPNKCTGSDWVVTRIDEFGNFHFTQIAARNGQFPCPGTDHGAAYMEDKYGNAYNTCVCPQGTQYCKGYWGYCGASATN